MAVEGKQRRLPLVTISIKTTKSDVESCENDKDSQFTLPAASSALLIIDVCLGFCSVILIYYTAGGQTEGILTDPTLCVPCEDVSLHFDENFVNLRKFGIYYLDEERAQCCTDNSTMLVQLTVERKSRIRIAQGYAESKLPLSCGEKQPPPSGHLSGKVSQLSANQTRESPAVQWQNNSRDVYLGGGVGFENGRLFANETNYYFLYSQLGYRTMAGGSCHFIHYVYRHPRGVDDQYREILLESVNNMCTQPGKEGIETSHIGSVIHLKPHQEVYVRVSHPDRLVTGHKMNAFGIYKV